MNILFTGVTSTKGYQHVLVIIDLYTKFQQDVSLKMETAEEVCEAWLQHWYAIHGAPEKLLTDQGSAFTSQLLYDMVKQLKVRKVFTTAYHPQTDDRVERQNQVITDMLAKLTGKKMSQWPRYLGIIAHAFNAVENSTTGGISILCDIWSQPTVNCVTVVI
jgi:transposase InsO family protein